MYFAYLYRQTKLHHKVVLYLELCERLNGTCSKESSFTTTSPAEVQPTNHVEISSIEDESNHVEISTIVDESDWLV
jgi:type IV pilus biogenesis protein CpaD/CtpE